MAELAEDDSDGEEDEEKDVQKDIDTSFGTDGLLTEKDKLKRKDAARLRTPFECRGGCVFQISHFYDTVATQRFRFSQMITVLFLSFSHYSLT